MASNCNKSMLNFKRGDDLKLDFTVQDTNSDASLAAYTVLQTETATLLALQSADPVVPADVISQQTVVDAAQTAYDDLIRVDITGWTMRSSVERSGKKIQDLLITVLDPVEGTFTLSATNAETALWPVSPLNCDIEFTRTQGVVSSETFVINVLRDVSKS